MGTARVIALGFFDGVHIGHSSLLERTVELARETGASPAVFTFVSHPDTLITGYPVRLLNTLSDRADLLRRLHGIEEVIFAQFDADLMHMPWQTFIDEMLLDKFCASGVVCGYDFHFGYLGEGNPARLMEHCRKRGVGCDIIDRVELDGITVSSTYIRRLIAQGEVEQAERFLGHPHVISGFVTNGKKLGSKLGVPTTNIMLPAEVQEPAMGVYFTRVYIGDTSHASVTNVGCAPTVGLSEDITVETSILDFSGDLYGKFLRIDFLKYVRPERRFSSIGELSSQIQEDLSSARKYFRAEGERVC